MGTLKIEACDRGKTVNPDAASQDSRWAQLLEQASNPATSPGKLRRLASIGNPALDECLAINPNTPFAVLKRLFLKLPRAILKNPIFHYRQITEGKSLSEMLSPCLKLALYIELRRSGQDDELESILPVSDRVQWLRSGPDVAPLDAPQLAALWECLAGDPAEKVRLELVQRFPPEGLAYFVQDPSVGVREKLAGATRNHCWIPQWRPVSEQPMLRLTTQERLAHDPEECVRCALASNPELDSLVLEILALDPSVTVRSTLGSAPHSDVSPCVWRQLAASAPEVALVVAANGKCPEFVRLELCNHPDAAVRQKAWAQVNLQANEIHKQVLPVVDQILQAVDRENDAVALASNRNIPDQVFERLLHARPLVTQALAAVENAPDRLGKLVFHADETTGGAALKRMSTCSKAVAKKLLVTGKKGFRLALAEMPGAGPASVRTELATDTDFDVRRATLNYLQTRVGKNIAPGVLKCLKVLATDCDASIRAAVARDARLETETLDQLSCDPAWEVRLQVLSCHSPAVDSDLGLLSAHEPGMRLRAATTLLSKDWRGDPKVSRKASEKAAKDMDPEVRVQAAKSPYSTCTALECLIEDADERIQQALADRPMFRSWCKTARINAGFPMRGHNPSRTAMASKNPALRAVAAGIVEPRLLRMLARDTSWFVRHTVANHPRVERAVLLALSEDLHPLVRTRALSRIMKP